MRDTLEGSAPVSLAIVTRSRGRASVPPGVLRATLDTHSSALADRKVRARVRLRAAYIGALACGVILGTPLGLLLEALRQGWRP